MSETSVETTVPGRNGGRLLAGGKKGHRGAGGRPPEVFKALCREMISDPKAQKAVAAILSDPDHPHFASMWKAVTERGYGKLEQKIEHTRKPYRDAVDEVRKGLRLVG